jgi:transcriptional regulator with XRE-family HTH domain
MAMIRSRSPLTSLTLRQCRLALALSQADFAAQLGVSIETYRTWDSGRRPVRSEMLRRANELALRTSMSGRRDRQVGRETEHYDVAPYHSERNYQGLGNRLIVGSPVIDKVGRVRRRSRLGGLLNFYVRAA